MMEVSKWFHFEAAHSLPHLPITHKCHRLHGHGYKVKVTCAGELDPVNGWVVDYADISKVMDTVIKAVDHDNIDKLFVRHRSKCSDPITFAPSTAENLAVWFYNQLKPTLPSVVEIRVKETDSTEVVFRPIRDADRVVAKGTPPP